MKKICCSLTFCEGRIFGLNSKSDLSHSLNISVDEIKDDAIHCFKASQLCEKDFSMLKDQLPALNEPKVNPFASMDGSQDEEELPLFMVVEDDHIDIEF